MKNRIRWHEDVWITWHADDGFMLERYSESDERLTSLPPQKVGENGLEDKEPDPSLIRSFAWVSMVMSIAPKKKVHEWLVTAPSLLWLILLFLIPTLIVFAIAFKPADLYGGIGAGWTLDTLRSLGNPNYPAIIWRTLYLSVLTTVACILLATPAGYCLARAEPPMAASAAAAGDRTLLDEFPDPHFRLENAAPPGRPDQKEPGVPAPAPAGSLPAV